jgi:parvulin-like peptidyl-prolyl isomerase
MNKRVATSLFGALLAVTSAGGSYGQVTSVQKGCPTANATDFRSISRIEVETLMRDVAASNPQVAAQLKGDPAIRQSQLNKIRELLAFASQALKDGATNDEVVCSELLNIRDETIAATYDKHLEQARPVKGQFAYISEARISAFWGGDATSKLTERVRDEREKAFQKFVETKKSVLGRNNPGNPISITDADVAAARDAYAKFQISVSEYKLKSPVLPAVVRDKIELQVKLQQAQFLARLYSDSISPRLAATDEEVTAFIAARPELSIQAKKAKAEQILQRAKSGEDFAKLANEFTQDPGNTDPNGVRQGGLYRDVRRGMMVAPFEKAALAVEAGQVNPAVVESDFGYHVVKLERKDASPSGTYDVRHILITTTVPDPTNPGGRELPLKQYAKAAVEEEKQDRMIAEVVAANSISVPADFSVTAAAPKPAAKPPVRKAPVRRTRKPK